MTKEEKEAVLHCLRSMIDEEHCEECSLYGTTGTDHCEKDCVRLAIEELEQDEYIKVPKKALKYRTAGIVAYNAEWLKNHFDIERAVICGVQEHYEDAISRQAVLDITWEEPSYTDAMNVLTEVRDKVKELPPVNPQKPICPSAGVDCEDCPVYEDTISRKAVLNTLENMDRALDEDRTVENYKELLRECYKVLPSVKPKSECEHDHEILKAYSDGANAVLDNVRAEIESKYESIPETFHHYETGFTDALEGVLSIIDKYKEEGGKK